MKHDLDYWRKRLRIDRDNLDEEVARQPTLFFGVCDAKAEALNERDMASERQKEVKATLFRKIERKSIREDPKKKAAATINSEVEVHPEYIAAREEYKRAESDLDRWDGMKEAFRQRSSALRALVELHRDSAYQSSTISPERDRLAEARRSGGRKRSRINDA